MFSVGQKLKALSGAYEVQSVGVSLDAGFFHSRLNCCSNGLPGLAIAALCDVFVVYSSFLIASFLIGFVSSIEQQKLWIIYLSWF